MIIKLIYNCTVACISKLLSETMLVTSLAPCTGYISGLRFRITFDL